MADADITLIPRHEREIENLRHDVGLYRAQVEGVARWLVDLGFPFNWSTSQPAPFFLKESVAALHAERDGEDDLGAYREMVEEAQAWR